MLSYELCKKLKDAGFPQNINESFYREGCEECKVGNFEIYRENLREEMIDTKSIKIPALSELIEACGDNLINLTNFETFWQTNFKDGMAGETTGKTPEEAVANLWLELNK